MKTTVGRTYRFRATHSLPKFPEPWCFPHQHDYTIEVEIEGDSPTDALDGRWAQIAPNNGESLNKRWPELEETTVEAIAVMLLRDMEALRVTVWEDKQRWGRAER